MTRRSVVIPLLVALVAAPLVGVAAPAFAANTDIKINEVESNGGTPVDWIELTNVGAASVDVSGWILKDNDNGHALAIPANTSIAPGAFLAVDVDVAGGFGLGADDSARVFLPNGTTLIDRYDWTSHASTTYARQPDGSFATSLVPTKGAANIFTPADAIRINEVESNGGTPVDWIELVNLASIPIDVSGWILRDNVPTDAVAIPAGTSIAANGFLAVDVDVAGGFGLGGADSAVLDLADGTTQVDSYSWTSHAATTYGRCPDGTGAFVTTASSTKSAANDCPAVGPTPAQLAVKINEVESNGDTNDWVELKNTGATSVDISGWILRDNVDTDALPVPAGTTLAPGALYTLNTDDAANSGPADFGLGAADSARLYLPNGTTLIDERSWTAHASVTLGMCTSTATWGPTTVSTKNAPNICAPEDGIRINEVESNGDTNDWVELYNAGPTGVDISGWILRDNKDTDALPVPASTTLAPGAFFTLVTDDAANDGTPANFGLGAPDSARLFLPDGTTLIDGYAWDTHAGTTYGRCPDGTGAFVTTVASSKGGANACTSGGGDPTLPPEDGPAARADALPWPGGETVTTVDDAGTFNQDASGAIFDPSDPAVLWLAQNKKGTLWKLRWNAATSTYQPDTASGWGAGRDPHFTDGGHPDTEGLTLGPDGDVYVTSERDNDHSNVSRIAVLQLDPATGDATNGITATREWNLQSDFPQVSLASSADANLGPEGITWVPDSYLVSRHFRTSTGALYDPAAYPGHGTGLFVVALEKDGGLYAFALGDDGTHALVASIPSGFPTIMDVAWDADQQVLRATCDNTCNGQSSLLTVNSITGDFELRAVYARPSGLPNYNNEGFAVAAQSTCADGVKRAVWTDDGDDDGFSLRAGTISCTVPAFEDVPNTLSATPTPTVSGTAAVESTLTATPGEWAPSPVDLAYQWNRGGVAIDGATSSTYTLTGADAGAAITVTVTGTKPGYTPVSSTSAATAPVAEGVLSATPVPGIVGSARVDSTLVAVPGAWAPAPVTLAYQWSRGGIPVGGATSSTYTLTGADAGAAITVTVTGSKPGYGAVSRTSEAAAVAPGALLAGSVSVAGKAKVGSTLTVATGSWGPAGIALSVQWLRNGTAIAGASGTAYTLGAKDRGAAITVRVTGQLAGYAPVVVTSRPTATVAAGSLGSVRPTIVGTLKAGKRLTAKVGKWKPAAVKLSYRWYRNGKPIARATRSSYTLKSADRGKRIVVKVTGSRAGYASVKRASVTKRIAAR
ncbi:lamin tail domain-containing protein [Galbitalea sp. SE-J8]|uniref:lamin tail domain-containing protein n=1 Tax=Galbitalea sp. SE-J8 TaxID=3054952 RepID=UPI00259CF617|nr:lamin tail domain-containing protein [Galbitalea sp. SE-J8]MDM4763851.1 lamin tail domain-containing protein [Galbitalea sp. SE-J8]